MVTHFPLRSLAVAVAAAALAGSAAGAQLTVSRRPPQDGAPQLQSPLKLTLTVAAQRYEFSGSARCVHAPRAALFDRPAASWTVQLKPDAGTGLRSFGLTLWRTNDAAAETTFSLFAVVDRTQYRISTMKGDTGRGSGTVTVTPRGAGGHFEFDGKTQDGVAIHGSIDCERFAAPSAAVGG